jgi:ribokinase
MVARIAVAGSLNMDLVVRSPRIPVPGETIIGSQFHPLPGGKGANQAVAAARLGAQVSLIGRVGNDAFARSLLDNLEANGIDHRFVLQEEKAATGVALIVVDKNGQNSIVVASGANMHLSPADVDRAETAIAQADALLLQLESPLETVLRAAEVARIHRVTVILNPAPARPLPPDLLALVDVLIPNQGEAALLAGMPLGTALEAQSAGRALQTASGVTVVLTLGERGALLVDDRHTEIVPAFRVKAVDTTAAGDAFVAGFAVALAEGRAPLEAVRWGNACGALAATRLGAQASLPLRSAVQELLAAGEKQSG